ncbi:MAG: GntR family transcriptional regulator [Planctomycetes bacterium]|nr:GntR family transcriptional regulator [Planctomycetota bacterium]
MQNLHSQLRAGTLRPGDFLPTVRELSKTYGVAHNTAWRALNALVAEKLVAAIPRRGYQVLSREEPAPGSGCVAWVLGTESIIGGWDLLYRRLVGYLEAGVSLSGGRLAKLIMSPGEETLILEQLASLQLSGLILDLPNPALLAWAREMGIHVVVVDTWTQDLAYDVVVQDGFAGGLLAGRHLIERGCRRIAWFGRSLDNYHGSARYAGARAALEAEGSAFAQQVYAQLDEKNLNGIAVEMLRGPDAPDGVVVLWRPMAEALEQAAKDLGKRAGRDFQMVGWSPMEVLEEEGHPLSQPDGRMPAMVTWSIEEMARMALARLAQRRREPSLPVTCTLLPMKLWAKESLQQVRYNS